MKLLIRGAEAVLPGGRRRVNIRVSGETIAEIGPGLEPHPDDAVIDAEGLLALPGLIDAHTHFQFDSGTMQTRDDFEAGSASAAAGGITTIMNFAPQKRGQSLIEAADLERAKAEGHTLIDFGLHLSLGTPGPNWEAELRQAVDSGISSIKVYTTYRDTYYYTQQADWERLMERSGPAGMLVQVHAEDDDIVREHTRGLLDRGLRSLAYHGEARPGAAETAAVRRGVDLVRLTSSPLYFVHLSSPGSLEVLAEARAEGLWVYGEACPHHFTLPADLYETEDAARYIMTPPLRHRLDTLRLLRGVATGAVEVLGSDHCAYGLDQRGNLEDFTDCSPGIPGVETLWPIVYSDLVATGLTPLEDAVAMLSSHPADIFGLPGKGRLVAGADADIVLYDPRPRKPLDEASLHSRAGYSPWHGRDIQGKVMRTIARGETVYQDGEIVGKRGRGRFLQCKPHTTPPAAA
ncbi:MAG: dihydroorotase [Chloroflexota bacterium]